MRAAQREARVRSQRIPAAALQLPLPVAAVGSPLARLQLSPVVPVLPCSAVSPTPAVTARVAGPTTGSPTSSTGRASWTLSTIHWASRQG